MFRINIANGRGGEEKDGIIMQCWFNREYNIHNGNKVPSGPVKQFTCTKRNFSTLL